MKTKMFFAAVALLCMVSVGANAQDGNNGRRQRMNRGEMIQRIADRMAQQMNLSTEKAETFKVLYIDYQTARYNAANPKGENENEQRVDVTKLTDEQATELIQKQFATQEAQLKVDKEFYPKFLEILTPAQTARVFLPQRNNNNGQRQQGGGMRGNGGGRQGGNGGFGGNFGGGDF